MDPPVEFPSMLRSRPEINTPKIFEFDMETGAAPGCPEFQGLCVLPDFFSPAAAESLLQQIHETPFVLAQSGKQKQHFGAKVNFNKRKLNASAFHGLPRYATPIEARLRQAFLVRVAQQNSAQTFSDFERALSKFSTTDLFVLRYEERVSSNLDFHVDDNFAYGEIIIDLSLESDSVMTFIHEGQPESGEEEAGARIECVRALLPARSAAVLFGPARFNWEHAILHYDIQDRRTSITLRTLSDELRQTEEGQRLLATARLAID